MDEMESSESEDLEVNLINFSLYYFCTLTHLVSVYLLLQSLTESFSSTQTQNCEQTVLLTFLHCLNRLTMLWPWPDLSLDPGGKPERCEMVCWSSYHFSMLNFLFCAFIRFLLRPVLLATRLQKRRKTWGTRLLSLGCFNMLNFVSC